MILKYIPNPKKSARKNMRVNKLGDYILNPEDKGNEKCCYWNTLNINAQEKEHVKDEILALAKCSTRSKDPIDHWVLSFKEGENPTFDQVDHMVKMVMEDFELEHHKCLYAVHSDTDNPHVHLMINKVCPLTQKVQQINNGLYKIAAQKAVARVCKELNFLPEDNDLYEIGEDGKAKLRKERGRDRKGKNWEADRAAQGYGEESISDRAKRELTDIFDHVESWQELHQELGKLGYRYERKGSGAVVWFDDVVIKASDASEKRNSSFGKLKKKLGEFESLDPEVKVSPKKKKSAPMQEDLREIAWVEYTQIRSNQRVDKKEAQASLNQRHRQEFSDLLSELKEERTSLFKGNWRGRGDALNAMRAVVAVEHGARKSQLKERQKREKEELMRLYPPFPKFRDWLAGGYDAAAAALFDTENMIYSQGQAVGLVPDLRDLEYSHSPLFDSTTFKRTGTGKTVFVDRGDRVSLASGSDEDIKLWLEYSAERYNGKFQIKNADPDFIRKAAKISAENGLRFELNGPNRETIELFNRVRSERLEELKPDWVKKVKPGTEPPAPADGRIGKERIAEIKKNIDAGAVLRFALEQGFSGNFELAEGNKINNLDTRNKPRNVVDFLVKDCGMSAPDAISKLDQLYKSEKKKSKKPGQRKPGGKGRNWGAGRSLNRAPGQGLKNNSKPVGNRKNNGKEWGSSLPKTKKQNRKNVMKGPGF